MPNLSARSREVEDAILANVRLGVTVRGSCGLAGIPRSTFDHWVQADPDLRERLQIAKEAGQGVLESEVLAIDESASKARVLTHRLGKMDRDEWGAENTVVLDGKMSIADAAKLARDAMNPPEAKP